MKKTRSIPKLRTLINIGFRRAGEWKMINSSLEFNLEQFPKTRNILYAFICDKKIKYIGKTVQTLKQRMGSYKNPGKTQTTNIKNNDKITKLLSKGKCIDIFVLPDNGLIHYGGFHLDLAAGLESSLISNLKPEWNNRV